MKFTKVSECLDATGEITALYISKPTQDQLWVLINLFQGLIEAHY